MPSDYADLVGQQVRVATNPRVRHLPYPFGSQDHYVGVLEAETERTLVLSHVQGRRGVDPITVQLYAITGVEPWPRPATSTR